MRKDFTGFTYKGIHSSTYGLIRVSNGSRYSEGLVPDFEDRGIDLVGVDGDLYEGRRYKKTQFQINVAFDELTETKFRQLRRWLGGETLEKFVFDERPYKTYWVKLASKPDFNYICFDNEEDDKITRIYKGEASITFIGYDPFGYTVDESYTLDDKNTGLTNWQAIDTYQEIYAERALPTLIEKGYYSTSLTTQYSTIIENSNAAILTKESAIKAEHKMYWETVYSKSWIPEGRTTALTGGDLEAKESEIDATDFSTAMIKERDAIINYYNQWQSTDWNGDVELKTSAQLNGTDESYPYDNYRDFNYISEIEKGDDGHYEYTKSISVYNPGDFGAQSMIKFGFTGITNGIDYSGRHVNLRTFPSGGTEKILPANEDLLFNNLKIESTDWSEALARVEATTPTSVDYSLTFVSLLKNPTDWSKYNVPDVYSASGAVYTQPCVTFQHGVPKNGLVAPQLTDEFQNFTFYYAWNSKTSNYDTTIFTTSSDIDITTEGIYKTAFLGSEKFSVTPWQGKEKVNYDCGVTVTSVYGTPYKVCFSAKFSDRSKYNPNETLYLNILSYVEKRINQIANFTKNSGEIIDDDFIITAEVIENMDESGTSVTYISVTDNYKNDVSLLIEDYDNFAKEDTYSDLGRWTQYIGSHYLNQQRADYRYITNYKGMISKAKVGSTDLIKNAGVINYYKEIIDSNVTAISYNPTIHTKYSKFFTGGTTVSGSETISGTIIPTSGISKIIDYTYSNGFCVVNTDIDNPRVYSLDWVNYGTETTPSWGYRDSHWYWDTNNTKWAYSSTSNMPAEQTVLVNTGNLIMVNTTETTIYFENDYSFVDRNNRVMSIKNTISSFSTTDLINSTTSVSHVMHEGDSRGALSYQNINILKTDEISRNNSIYVEPPTLATMSKNGQNIMYRPSYLGIQNQYVKIEYDCAVKGIEKMSTAVTTTLTSGKYLKPIDGMYTIGKRLEESNLTTAVGNIIAEIRTTETNGNLGYYECYPVHFDFSLSCRNKTHNIRNLRNLKYENGYTYGIESSFHPIFNTYTLLSRNEATKTETEETINKAKLGNDGNPIYSFQPYRYATVLLNDDRHVSGIMPPAKIVFEKTELMKESSKYSLSFEYRVDSQRLNDARWREFLRFVSEYKEIDGTAKNTTTYLHSRRVGEYINNNVLSRLDNFIFPGGWVATTGIRQNRRISFNFPENYANMGPHFYKGDDLRMYGYKIATGERIEIDKGSYQYSVEKAIDFLPSIEESYITQFSTVFDIEYRNQRVGKIEEINGFSYEDLNGGDNENYSSEEPLWYIPVDEDANIKIALVEDKKQPIIGKLYIDTIEEGKYTGFYDTKASTTEATFTTSTSYSEISTIFNIIAVPSTYATDQSGWEAYSASLISSPSISWTTESHPILYYQETGGSIQTFECNVTNHEIDNRVQVLTWNNFPILLNHGYLTHLSSFQSPTYENNKIQSLLGAAGEGKSYSLWYEEEPIIDYVRLDVPHYQTIKEIKKVYGIKSDGTETSLTMSEIPVNNSSVKVKIDNIRYSSYKIIADQYKMAPNKEDRLYYDEPNNKYYEYDITEYSSVDLDKIISHYLTVQIPMSAGIGTIKVGDSYVLDPHTTIEINFKNHSVKLIDKEGNSELRYDIIKHDDWFSFPRGEHTLLLINGVDTATNVLKYNYKFY